MNEEALDRAVGMLLSSKEVQDLLVEGEELRLCAGVAKRLAEHCQVHLACVYYKETDTGMQAVYGISTSRTKDFLSPTFAVSLLSGQVAEQLTKKHEIEDSD